MSDVDPPVGVQVTLYDYIVLFRRHGVVLGAIVLAALVTTAVLTVLAPRVYEARATLLVPRETGGGGLLGGLAASGFLQQVPGLSLPSLAPNRDMLVSILRSRTVAEAVIEKFGLRERYRVETAGQALKTLQDATTITLSREGLITVRVEDRDPRLAAAITNFYVERLDTMVARYGISEASRQRAFVSEQLARARTRLVASEEALRRFQERNRAIVLQEQTKSAIEAAARLKGEIVAAEVQLQVLRSFATESNPDLVALKRRIEEMRRQLAQMEYGDGTPAPRAQSTARDRRDFSVPFARVPEVGLDLARLTRDVKAQDTIVILLAQQLEQTMIAEAKDLPVVQVLDPALPPERHFKPRLRPSLLLAGMASLFVGVVLVFLLEYVRRLPRLRPGT